MGNLTRDPELKHLQNGTSVCDLGLAVNDSYKNKAGEKVESVLFCDITFFGRVAEICAEYLTKGSKCLIQGKLKLETWKDKESGANRSKMKVIGDSMQMLGSKDGGGKKSGSSSESHSQSGSSSEYEGSAPSGSDEVPF